ncbi:hypothetical protein KW801_03995 [Candidatus Saccharibacteria bacterium]|nr:hypothetical protein [Candidatus Saccharibacteria bacterium]
MKRSSSKKKFLMSKRSLLAVIGVIVLASLVSYLLLANHSSQNGQTTGTAADGSQINLNPATTSDKDSNTAHKNEIAQRDQKLSDGTNQGAAVSVVITEATSSTVKAYVIGVFEDGGSCTATASNGSQTVSGSSTGFQNVSYTQCPPISWSSALGAGQWTVTVNYKSATAQASRSTTITI